MPILLSKNRQRLSQGDTYSSKSLSSTHRSKKNSSQSEYQAPPAPEPPPSFPQTEIKPISPEEAERLYKKTRANQLYDIGEEYNGLAQPERALGYFKEALHLYREINNTSREFLPLIRISETYDYLGEREKALDFYNQVLSIFKKLGNRQGEADTLLSIASVYDKLGESQKALDYYNQALIVFRKIGDHRGENEILNRFGLLPDSSGKEEKTLEYYQQLLFKLEQERDKLDRERQEFEGIHKILPSPTFSQVTIRIQIGDTLNRIGKLYHQQKKLQKSLESYNQSLMILDEAHQMAFSYFMYVNIAQIYAINLNDLGLVYLDLEEFQKALDNLDKSLGLFKAYRNQTEQANTLFNIAYIERKTGNLQAALTPMQQSVEIIESLRTKVVSHELRQTYFATVQGYYQFYIDLLMSLHQQNPSQGYDKQAFNISERSRARTLLELLTEANANIKEGADPQLLSQEKSLQSQLDAVEKQRLDIYNNPNSKPEQKTAIDQQLKTLNAQYSDLQNEIRKTSPKYAALKYPQPLTLEQVRQQILDEDSVLLQYALGEERSYLWVVTKEGMTSYQLPAQAEIEKRATNLLRTIKQGNQTAFAQAEPLLSQVILAPAKDKINKKRILVVADGVLQYVPFASLSLAENQQPLITQYEIINLPYSSSLATIRNEVQARKSAPKTVAILANPVFSKDDQRVKNGKNTISQQPNSDLSLLALNRSVRSLEDGKFNPLPGTRQEATDILKLVPENNQKTSYFDFDANLPAATNPQLSQYRIVHFATHGIFNTESPELSGIILSLVDKNGNTVNGFLRLNEIFNLNLPADLVVVSACETGLGKEIKGEGLVGLTRGFMYAGSPRLLVSLWKVNDKATAEFMTRFYKLILEKKLPPAEALREAQLEMQQETDWKSPYYWAAFTLQGEWR
jgi:CHAT domain-containing protein